MFIAPGFLDIFGSFVFVAAIAIIGFGFFRGLSTWASNNASPLLTHHATVLGKRAQVSGGGADTAVSTLYYITFELENGERKELQVRADVYGVLFEGDRGALTWQGTRYKGFTRSE